MLAQQNTIVLTRERDELFNYRHETESRIAFLTQEI